MYGQGKVVGLPLSSVVGEYKRKENEGRKGRVTVSFSSVVGKWLVPLPEAEQTNTRAGPVCVSPASASVAGRSAELVSLKEAERVVGLSFLMGVSLLP